MTTITLTSKGQVTLPVEMRRKMGLKDGDTLQVGFDEQTKSIEIKKPMTIDELQKMVQGFIKKDVKPVLDVDAYYQKYRKVRSR